MKLLIPSFITAVCLTAAIRLPAQLPEAKVTARVVAENGDLISGATVEVVFDKMAGNNLESFLVSGLTNAAGIYSASGPTVGQGIGGRVNKAGYYKSSFRSPLLSEVVRHKWQPWNPTVSVVLKKIEKPIPMFAKKVDTDVPATDKPIGFDLEKGDWVAPYGRGKIPDLLFTLQRRYNDALDYEANLTVGFPSSAEGIQAWADIGENSSALKLPRFAPEDGYTPVLTHTKSRRPGARLQGDGQHQRNYFVRVRTVLDQQGKIVSALYGKIDGDIRFSPIHTEICSLMFTYYLNPTPNDRNMEFDPKRNLLSPLKDEEKVSDP